MNESAAREVVLVRAIEQTDQAQQLLSQDDRHYATKSARELAQWDAMDGASQPMAERFLHKRAGLILKKLTERTPAFGTYSRSRNFWLTMGVALPLAALLFGAVVDRVGDPHRVDLLSAPLLLIVCWNLLVYVALLLQTLLPNATKRWRARYLGSRVNAGWLSHLGSRLKGKLPQRLGLALTQFNAEWLYLSKRLTHYRLKRILHSSAAGLALGAVISLYLRGLLSQYRAGWESTFLNAEQVHGLLSLLFAPAMFLLQLPGFSVEEVRALHFADVASPEGGARWVHLYAATLLLLVVLPRLLLAAYGGWRERRLSRHFPLDLNTPYFHRLITLGAPEAVGLQPVMQVHPYSFHPDAPRQQQLDRLAQRLLGSQARLQLEAPTAYGEEAAASMAAQPQAVAGQAQALLVCALFNLSATPEKENHGVFLAQLRQQHPQRLVVLVDESGYRERLGSLPDAETRLQERVALWRQFCALYETKANVIDLQEPARSTDDVERRLDALALGSSA